MILIMIRDKKNIQMCNPKYRWVCLAIINVSHDACCLYHRIYTLIINLELQNHNESPLIQCIHEFCFAIHTFLTKVTCSVTWIYIFKQMLHCRMFSLQFSCGVSVVFQSCPFCSNTTALLFLSFRSSRNLRSYDHLMCFCVSVWICFCHILF